MIHILTVHWQSDRWIDLQLEFLARNLRGPYRVYAFLNGLECDRSDDFFYSSTDPIQDHATKLNLLAGIAAEQADSDDDILIFLDGDAFPIAPLDSFLVDSLATHPLLAVQRLENLGDPQPHPSFCATTISFWEIIRGDWQDGHRWTNSLGQSVTDVGGTMLHRLRETGAPWLPLLRSNRSNLHPLWFGVYEDLIYHHGAGFRSPTSRVDFENAPQIMSVSQRVVRRVKHTLGLSYENPLKLERQRIQERTKKESGVLSEQVLDLIESDSEFFRYFLSSDKGLLEAAVTGQK